MNRPMILATPRNASKELDNRVHSNNESYYDFIHAAGGILATCGIVTQEEAEELANLYDGLLVTGGADVNPTLYHEENTASEPIEDDYENTDLLLYQAFLKKKKPILGICRGIQIIAVAEGSSLVQDIPTTYHVEHNQMKFTPAKTRNDTAHPIKIQKGSVLTPYFTENDEVNSFHHQCVKEVPYGFQLSALNQEGMVEGFENDQVLCVQWHPERLIDHPSHLAIGKIFIERCLLCKSK